MILLLLLLQVLLLLLLLLHKFIPLGIKQRRAEHLKNAGERGTDSEMASVYSWAAFK